MGSSKTLRNFIMTEVMFNFIQGLMIIETSYIVLMIIGWICCTDYFDYIYDFFEEFLFIILHMFTSCVCILWIVGNVIYYVTGNFVEPLIPILYISLIYTLLVIGLLTTYYILNGIFNLRNYFKRKRGK